LIVYHLKSYQLCTGKDKFNVQTCVVFGMPNIEENFNLFKK